MFKEFWEKKKSIIEATGILTAIGALFLNIDSPSNELARKALLNIQMAWLLVISIMSIFLFANFWLFFMQIENKIERKISREMPISIFGIFIYTIGGWFLWNLWKYLLELYKQELKEFFSLLVLIPFGLSALVVLYFEKKCTKLYIENRKLKYYLSISGVSIISAILYAFLIELIKINFELKSFLKSITFFFCIAFSACLIFTFSKIREIKKLKK